MDETPESDVPASWMECSIYQNYTASEVLVQVHLLSLYEQLQVYLTVHFQSSEYFEQTNSKLLQVFLIQLSPGLT